MLTTVLQTPDSFSEHLQRPCKLQKVFRGICSIPANAKKFFAAFAAFLQTPKSFSRHLQHFCKDQKVFRSICSIPAEAKKFFAAFAAFLQSFPKAFWPSRGFRGCSLLAFFLHRTSRNSSLLSPMRLTSAN